MRTKVIFGGPKWIVIFNHEGIAIIETMAPTLNSETEMLIAFNVFEVFDIWMVYVGQETEKCQLISNCSIYESYFTLI